MRILAQWIPTTPEMEVKVLFGRHVWDCARHADQLGKRAFELRAPLNYTLPATAAYQRFLDDICALSSATDRVAGFYEAARPGLIGRYLGYCGITDALMDEPTVRIIEGAIRDFERMDGERGRLLKDAPLAPSTIRASEWLARERVIDAMVEHGGESGRARGVRP